MPSTTKRPSKTALAKDTLSQLDAAEGWDIKTGPAPIPDALAKTIGNTVDISISSIVEDHALQQYGLEFDPESNVKQKGLLNNIKKYGVQIPICVKEIAPGQYRIVYGHKRVICSRILKNKTIKAIVADPSVDDNILHIIENLFRTEPSTYSNALAAQALLGMEIRKGVRYNRDDVAGYFSWSREWLDQLLEILSAPAPLVEFFKAGADPKDLRPVWVQIRKSGKSPQEQEMVCQALRDLGVSSLEPFVLYSRDQRVSITEAVERIQAEEAARGSGAPSSPPALLKKPMGRPHGSRGSVSKATTQMMGQRLWDPIWLQKNGDEAKDMLVRMTGISNSKADSLVLDHSAGTGCSLGLATLAALAMVNPLPSSKPLDEKSALELAKKLYSGSIKSGRKIVEQYLSALSLLPDMMEGLREADKPLYDYARRVFGARKVAPRGRK
jgi:ParB/RepB/Spo0J family partition protein